ncbi:hypothetical protein [Pseudomonas nitroreducens]|uniref:Uncharacterized protein n=1 Tax=Pseudomonas nitroreducens TaxID=46680 RepID=A0A6G6IUQ8_PSENT|nr:hypothetical protein [Pseudomonas nitroreducens]QIE85971.1 hypothetical protein G5B91_06690 [Pseudomonas nitroreducens]
MMGKRAVSTLFRHLTRPQKRKTPETLGISGVRQGVLERAKGTENRIQPIDLENNISVRSMRLDTIMYRFRPLGKPVAC